MSESNQSQRLEPYEKHDENMNEPGEMNLNDLINEGMMSEKNNNFDLDMNFIEMDEMDFDLIKKDQQLQNQQEAILDQQRETQVEKQSQIEAQKQGEVIEQVNQIEPQQIPQNDHQAENNNLKVSDELHMEEENPSQFAILPTQQNDTISNSSSLMIDTSSPKITPQKFEIIKLIADHFYNNKLEDGLKIKEENQLSQPQKHEKIEFHLTDQKFQHPKLNENEEDADIKQHLLKTMKGLFEKKESFYDSESSDTDYPLKIDMLKDEKLGGSYQYSKNLLKEFKNESFQVRDRYFEKQSQIYKKYILNMKKTLRKQYERCRVHEDERIEQTLQKGKLQERDKCQVQGNKKSLRLFKNQNKFQKQQNRMIKSEAQFNEQENAGQQADNPHKQTIVTSQSYEFHNAPAQRNTHQQSSPESINHGTSIDEQQQLRSGPNLMSLQEGQIGPMGMEMISLIENEEDECTPMFGIEISGESNQNSNENNNQSNDATESINVSAGQSLTTISRTNSSTNNNNADITTTDQQTQATIAISQLGTNQQVEKKDIHISSTGLTTQSPILAQTARAAQQKSIQQMSAEELREFIKRSMSSGVKRDATNTIQLQSIIAVEGKESQIKQNQLQQLQQSLQLEDKPTILPLMMIELEQHSAATVMITNKGDNQQDILIGENNIRNNNNDIIEIISQDSEQSIQVPRKPSPNLQHHTTTTPIQQPQTDAPPTLPSSTTQISKQTVSASDVRSLLLQSYPNIEQIIGAASDEEILALYYELTGREDESQQQLQQDNDGVENLGQKIGREQQQLGQQLNQQQLIQQVQQAQQQPQGQQQELVSCDNTTSAWMNTLQPEKPQLQPEHHPINQDNQLTPQPPRQQQQLKQDLTPEELDLVIQNLIQSNSQIKEQISKLSRQDLLALYKQGIREMASRKANDITNNCNNPAINSNSSVNANTTGNRQRKNKKNAIAEIIDLEQDQHQEGVDRNANNNAVSQQQQQSRQRENQVNGQMQEQQQSYNHNDDREQQQQHQSAFSYLDQYNKAIAHNIKRTKTKTNPTSITYKVNKTYLYALLQAHDYQNNLESIFKPRQSIKYQQQTEKEISTLYLKHLKTHNVLKSTGLQIKASINKSEQNDKENKFFILTKKGLKENKSSGFSHIDEKFRKHVHEGKYLTAERTIITEEKKKRILELRNKRIAAEKMKSDLYNKTSWRNDIHEQEEIPKLSTIPYMNTLLAPPQQPYRRYYLFVEQESLDPREMNRLEEEIGLQHSKKRVKRTVMERDEKEIARMIKRFAMNIDQEMGIELQ